MSFAQTILDARGRRLLIGGHRGHLSQVRENTIVNFAQVLGMGVDYIEIDVQLSRDGQAVIFHDMELADRTPLSGRVHDYTVAQLKAAFELDTLEEALRWCKAHQLRVLLEIKGRELETHDDMPILARRIVEALRETDAFDDVIVFGIDHATLRRITDMEPRTVIALIVPHVPHDPVALMKDMGALIYLSFIDNLSRPLVEQLHAAGYIVDGSVINSPERLQLALDIGCDMIESDVPDQVIAWYRAMGREAEHHA